MKLIIDIPKEEFENLKNSTRPMYWSEHLIKNGTPISDNATNGDVIKAIFGSDKVFDFKYCVHLRAKVGNWFNEGVVAEFYKDWWNAKYKSESEVQDADSD